SLVLPFIGADEAKTTDLPSLIANVEQARGIRLMVIEDEDSIRTTIERLFASVASSVRSFASVEEAEPHLEHETFDLVIADKHLPGKNGDDFIFEQKQLHPEVRFLLISGDPDANLESFADTDQVDFMTKPLELNALLKHTRNIQPRAESHLLAFAR
ncbi:MAG: response regulator, partial [Verrucomicrobiota bacterium]